MQVSTVGRKGQRSRKANFNSLKLIDWNRSIAVLLLDEVTLQFLADTKTPASCRSTRRQFQSNFLECAVSIGYRSRNVPMTNFA